MNGFFLLALGLVGCWAIGALNRNTRVGLYLLASLLVGFVGGALGKELVALKKVKELAVIAPKSVNGTYGSTVLFFERLRTLETPSSGVLSQDRKYADTQDMALGQQLCVTWGHGLSPPSIEDSS